MDQCLAPRRRLSRYMLDVPSVVADRPLGTKTCGLADGSAALYEYPKPALGVPQWTTLSQQSRALDGWVGMLGTLGSGCWLWAALTDASHALGKRWMDQWCGLLLSRYNSD